MYCRIFEDGLLMFKLSSAHAQVGPDPVSVGPACVRAGLSHARVGPAYARVGPVGPAQCLKG